MLVKYMKEPESLARHQLILIAVQEVLCFVRTHFLQSTQHCCYLLKWSEKCLPTHEAISSTSETFCSVRLFCCQEVLTGCLLFISGLSHHQSSSVALQTGKSFLFLVLHRILSLRQATSARFSLSVMNKPTVEEQIYTIRPLLKHFLSSCCKT